MVKGREREMAGMSAHARLPVIAFIGFAMTSRARWAARYISRHTARRGAMRLRAATGARRHAARKIARPTRDALILLMRISISLAIEKLMGRGQARRRATSLAFLAASAASDFSQRPQQLFHAS